MREVIVMINLSVDNFFQRCALVQIFLNFKYEDLRSRIFFGSFHKMKSTVIAIREDGAKLITSTFLSGLKIAKMELKNDFPLHDADYDPFSCHKKPIGDLKN